MDTHDQKYAIEIENLTVAYDAKPVLWNINLKIPQGLLTAIVGPNGAGKSTLIKSILGLQKPISGTIRFHENDIRHSLKNQIGYIPQNGSVDWDFPVTVQDVVLMGCYGKLGWIKRPRKKDYELTQRVLAKVGMAEYSSRQISQLSGGQQQRVFFARALAQEADVYFMDEPFKGIDIQTKKTIFELLQELKRQGKTVVVVHHDLHTVKEYFDWVALINKQLIASGPVNRVFEEENLKKTYHCINPVLRMRDAL
jgi:manganese/zinc/iron transport system ATP- binding protein